eukprot:TRINITY_DN8760_c0_g1_i1.p1 TRINITY_DN8760_c0_g1~~TRINITY_DN8760_c0_g1_i1.p1  ORF type:complete len:506 (-),score=85.92 TRINITY_DN8760_c0_g1_i1:640-2157(-)
MTLRRQSLRCAIHAALTAVVAILACHWSLQLDSNARAFAGTSTSSIGRVGSQGGVICNRLVSRLARSAGLQNALWFRYDLRLDDNLALTSAVKESDELLPLCSARRAKFILQSVGCLRERLESRGSGLAVFLGKPGEVIPRLCADAATLFVTQSVCSEEKTDEADVEQALKKCKLKRVWGNTLYMPDKLGQHPDKTPLQFTKFRTKAESAGAIQEPIEAPKKIPSVPTKPSPDLQRALNFMPTLRDLGYADEEINAVHSDDPRGVMPFKGGEYAAIERLEKWMWKNDKLRKYFEIRNGMLGEGYSSKFSPWMALGCLSPRRVWKECQRYEKEREKNKSTYWLVFEMLWRDFFVYMTRGYGTKIFRPGGITGAVKTWKGGEEALQRWKDGETGDPLVDANMRELKATGWMSNRGRQNVASYLIFDMGVDWRYGAAHFEEHLLDYDPHSNWGNWVAAAGLTGGRVNKFNTKKQAKDYDPGGNYINHWLTAAQPSGGRVKGKLSRQKR